MERAKTPAERTDEARAAAAQVIAYPVIDDDPANPSAAPAPFDGEWQHSTDIAFEIFANGWKPERVRNTIYGAAVYLSRSKWNLEHRAVIRCKLHLQATECQATFASTNIAPGTSQDHLLWYVGKVGGFAVGRNAGPANSTQNRRITAFFRDRGIKAIAFEEHQTLVVAVYDPSCIRVVR